MLTMPRKYIIALLLSAIIFSGEALAAKKQATKQTENAAVETTDDWADRSDPLEPLNRAIYRFNYVADGVILRPAASIYRGVLPEKGQEMVSNALRNLYTPVTFFNSVLQADPHNSFASLWRFLLNSTFGILGLFDFATEAGLTMRTTDLGQTFAIYGAGTGPYIVLPIIGPSNGRDAIGRVGDAFMNPFNYISNEFTATMWSATAVEKRASNMKLIDDIYDSSLDPYSTFKSGYTQHRASSIARAKAARKNSRRASGFQ